MARRQATLKVIPASLAQAVEATMALPTSDQGHVAAQREILAALENALDARRQRILVSQSAVNWVKWMVLIFQAVCTLAAIAMVHCDNRATAKLALGLFSTAIAFCILLIVAHDRSFTGQLAVSPAALLQVEPESTRVEPGR
jgi:hypothetical protein